MWWIMKKCWTQSETIFYHILGKVSEELYLNLHSVLLKKSGLFFFYCFRVLSRVMIKCMTVTFPSLFIENSSLSDTSQFKFLQNKLQFRCTSTNYQRENHKTILSCSFISSAWQVTLWQNTIFNHKVHVAHFKAPTGTCKLFLKPQPCENP